MSTISTTAAPITIRIVGHTLPGLDVGGVHNLHVGVQHKVAAVDLVPGDAGRAEFTIPVDVVPGKTSRFDFRGPFVQGKRSARFVYLTWGGVDVEGSFEMVGRLKIQLSALDDDMLVAAQKPGSILEGSLSLSDDNGKPVCGSLSPDRIRWTVD
jgi:hypothetical protein